MYVRTSQKKMHPIFFGLTKKKQRRSVTITYDNSLTTPRAMPVVVTNHVGSEIRLRTRRMRDVFRAITSEWGMEGSRIRVWDVTAECMRHGHDGLQGDETLMVEALLPLEFSKLLTRFHHQAPVGPHGATIDECHAACVRVGEFTQDGHALRDVTFRLPTDFPQLHIRFVVHDEDDTVRNSMDLLLNIGDAHHHARRAVVHHLYTGEHKTIRIKFGGREEDWSTRHPTFCVADDACTFRITHTALRHHVHEWTTHTKHVAVEIHSYAPTGNGTVVQLV